MNVDVGVSVLMPSMEQNFDIPFTPDGQPMLNDAI
jgi:hypothetical protein